jgi:DNA-binding transcriptional LysR family regulator
MLGVKLFDRSVHGVEPTGHGLSFAPRAIAIFEELRRAAQDLAAISSGRKGSLRVGIVPMPSIPFLPIAIARLVAAHPDVFVSVVEAIETDLLDRLRKRDIELAILRLSLFAPDPDLQVAALFEEKLCVVASRDHPLARREHLSWDDLMQARWVMPPPDCYFFEHVLRVLDQAGLPLPGHTVESFSIHIQYGMVLHGGMLSFGMRSQFEFSPDKNLLVKLPFDMPSVPKAVGALSLRSHQPSPLAQQLIAHIRSLAAPV